MTDGPAAGWYPDPLQRYDHRYWDGSTWTHHVSKAGQAMIDPASQAYAGAGTGTQGTASDTAAGSEVEDGSGVRAPDFAAVGSAPDDATPAQVTPAHGAVAPGAGGGGPAATAPAWQPAPTTTTTNVKAILSLILSIVWIFGLGSLAGIILGVMGRRDIDRSDGRESGAGLALAGIILGVVGLLGTIAVAVAIGAFVQAVEDGSITEVFGESVVQGAANDLSFSLVDVDFHQEKVLAETGRYAQTVDELVDAGWLVSDGVEVEVYSIGSSDWCVEAVSDQDATLTWTTFHDDPDGPGPGTC